MRRSDTARRARRAGRVGAADAADVEVEAIAVAASGWDTVNSMPSQSRGWETIGRRGDALLARMSLNTTLFICNH